MGAERTGSHKGAHSGLCPPDESLFALFHQTNMVGRSLTRSATSHRLGEKNALAGSLRGSNSQPKLTRGITFAGQVPAFRTTPQSGGNTTKYRYGAPARKTPSMGERGKDKILNWYSLPASAGWVPSARAVSKTESCATQKLQLRSVVHRPH